MTDTVAEWKSGRITLSELFNFLKYQFDFGAYFYCFGIYVRPTIAQKVYAITSVLPDYYRPSMYESVKDRKMPKIP